MNLEGRSAVVAGGAGGLGSATVRHLVGLGVGVVVIDPDLDRSEALRAEIGDSVKTILGTSNDDDVVSMAIAEARSLGVFSVAVSATGVLIRSPRLVESGGTAISRDVLTANLDVHVMGPFNLARLTAAAFASNPPDEDGQRGVIIQTASISAFDGQETMVPYAAAKGAIVSMTLPMARDLAPLGVRVCAIAAWFVPHATDVVKLCPEAAQGGHLVSTTTRSPRRVRPPRRGDRPQSVPQWRSDSP